ncbi:MAG: hypothetical protein FJ295_19120 [Planctomycetes bacterium]|nr:hypothetical protein [Planctomycetota bacterium]
MLKVLQARMARPVNWDFHDVSLDDVMQWVESTHGIQSLLDRQSIETAGASSDTPVTMTLSGVPLAKALRLMLRPHGLTYIARNGVVIVTSNEVAEANLVTRVYPVKDLAQVSRSRQDFGAIVDLIKKCTGTPRPGWVDDGGVGTVEPFPAGICLGINATEEVHEQIVGLLTALRNSREAQGLQVLHFSRETVPRVAYETTRPNAQRSSSRANSLTSARAPSGHLMRR